MAEAIISRRGNSSSIPKGNLITATYLENNTFSVPYAINNEFSVFIYGAGGGGGTWCGGGGGWMNNGVFTISAGSVVPITIGTGGDINNSGGSTSFGTYLSANGGSAGNSQWGGNGGAGGGTGWYMPKNSFGRGGTGYQFGGGGYSGNGGPYGGGAGGVQFTYWFRNSRGDNIGYYTPRSHSAGRGGAHGGNGGSYTSNGNNGINTIDNSEVDETLQGPGLASNVFHGTRYANSTTYHIYAGGSGGGYGGSAGRIAPYIGGGDMPVMGHEAATVLMAGVSGAGGYGANGGNATSLVSGG